MVLWAPGAVLGVIVAAELLLPPADAVTPDVGAKARVEPPPIVEMRKLPALDAFADIGARTIFHASRRPVEPIKQEAAPAAAAANAAPPPLPPPPPPPPLPNMTLVGILSTANGGSALVSSPSAKETLLLRPGDKVSGWDVAEIADDRIVFRHGEELKELTFPTKEGAEPRNGAPQRAGRPGVR
jgi:hypothetical protein